MSGFAVCNKLRKDEQLRQVPLNMLKTDFLTRDRLPKSVDGETDVLTCNRFPKSSDHFFESIDEGNVEIALAR